MGLLGYQLEYQSRGREINGKIYPISHRTVNRAHMPVHIIGCNEPAGLDRKPEKTGMRMSAHAMVQEYLNLEDELYAIVTNGRLLRLLRDSSRLVKLTYLDLDCIFNDSLFADCAILFRLLHVSRMPASPPPLALHHGFYELEYLAENDRIRYTISPNARKEVLRRLLALNHQHAAQEAANVTSQNKGNKSKTKDQYLFEER